jgi:hypothetical protein
VGDECARVWGEIWQRQPLLFLSFRERGIPSLKSLTSKISPSENVEVELFWVSSGAGNADF